MVIIYLFIIYSFIIIVIIIVSLPKHPLVQEFPDSAHVRYIKILMWLRGFFILFSKFGLVFFVLKSLLGIARQGRLKKFAILTLKSQSHVRILIYWTWAIKSNDYFGRGGGREIGEEGRGDNLIHKLNLDGQQMSLVWSITCRPSSVVRTTSWQPSWTSCRWQAQGVNDTFNWRVFCFHFSHYALP